MIQTITYGSHENMDVVGDPLGSFAGRRRPLNFKLEIIDNVGRTRSFSGDFSKIKPFEAKVVKFLENFPISLKRVKQINRVVSHYPDLKNVELMYLVPLNEKLTITTGTRNGSSKLTQELISDPNGDIITPTEMDEIIRFVSPQPQKAWLTCLLWILAEVALTLPPK